MIASYGETSGFSPVSNAELENINGGFWPELIFGIVGTIAIAIIAISGDKVVNTVKNGK